MKVYNHRKRNLWSGPHIAGLVLVLVGIFAIISPYILDSGSSELKSLIVGLCAIILGAAILSSCTGTVIHFENNSYKEYTSIAGIKVGEWQKIPTLSSIVLDKREFDFRSTHNGITPTFVSKISEYRVALLDGDSRLVLSLIFEDKNEVVKVGEMLASKLNILHHNRIN